MDNSINENFKAGFLSWLKQCITIQVDYSDTAQGQRITKIDIPIVAGFIIITIKLFNSAIFCGYIEL